MELIDIKVMALFLRAYDNKLRKNILKIFIDANHSKLLASDIWQKLNLEQSVCSQHLAILIRAEIIISERDGKYFKYYLNEPKLKLIQELNDLYKSNIDNNGKI
jgi:DNA-binding transcriptional ArsR family regulator